MNPTKLKRTLKSGGHVFGCMLSQMASTRFEQVLKHPTDVRRILTPPPPPEAKKHFPVHVYAKGKATNLMKPRLRCGGADWI